MSSNINVGVYKTNITPPVGITMEGSYSEYYAHEIIDDLYSNALVIDDGKKEIAIVSVDVCCIPNCIFSDIICRIEKTCGILKKNIIIASTHTHTGPRLENGLPVADKIWDEYVECFKDYVVTSVFMAQKRKQPVRIGVGKGRNGNHVFVRRLKKPNGSIIMNWTDKSFLQDCTETGRVDPEVLFVVIEDMNKKPISFIVNYANHNNAMGLLGISADWAGCLSRILAKVYGRDVITLFIPGACGNVNWTNYRDLDQGYGPGVVEKIATSLAGVVMENMSAVEYLDTWDISVIYKKIQIPDRLYREYDTKKDITFGQDEKHTEDFLTQYRLAKKLDEGKELPINEVDIHAVRIGKHIAIVTNPGELFSEFGLAIKAQSPFKYTIVSELTNGCEGYICTAEAFDEGGYEVRKAGKASHLAFDAGDRIVKTSLELLNELR